MGHSLLTRRTLSLTQRETDGANPAMAFKPRQLRRVKCRFISVHCLLQLYLACLVACELQDLSFVPAASWVGHGTKGKARKRFTQRFSQPQWDAGGEAKRLTSKIKNAQSAKKLIEALDGAVDSQVFNFVHASATYTRLASVIWRNSLQQSDWKSPVLLRLHARVKAMALEEHLDEQASTTILYSLAWLSDRFSLPTELLDALVKSMPTKLRGMDEQRLSNSLWACARLQSTHPVVLDIVPKIAAQIPKKAKDLVPQDLSNCLWASAQLKNVAPDVLETVLAIAAQIPNKAKDMIPPQLSNCLLVVLQLKSEVPEVLEIVPAIVGEIPPRIKDTNPQEMSNSLEALVLLRDSVPKLAGFLAAGGNMDDIVRSAAERLDTVLPQATGKDLCLAAPVVVWACAKVGIFHHGLLTSVAQHLGSKKKMITLPDFGVGALLWSYQVLDTRDEFSDFRKLLTSEANTSRRQLSEADVASCALGRFQWNGAT